MDKEITQDFLPETITAEAEEPKNYLVTFNENDECITVIDEANNDGFPIDLHSIESIIANGFGGLIIKANVQIDEVNTEHLYIFNLKGELARELVEKFTAWKNNGTPKPETRHIDVRCPNDEENKVRIADKMVKLNKENYTHEMEIKDLNSRASSHREGIKQNNEKLKALADEYEAEFINRAKECYVIKDYDNSEIRYIDPDNGDIVESAKMTAKDKQTTMDDILPETVPATETDEVTDNDKTMWWDFSVSYENADGTNFMKPGMTEKRLAKIQPAMYESPKFIALVGKFNEAHENEIENCLKEFVEIAYGLMIDSGLIK